MDLGQPPNGREVLRRGLQYVFELGARLVVLLELNQGTPERDTRGKIGGMLLEAAAADLYSLVVRSCAAVFLGELREGNRRRVLLDPAS